MKRTPRIMAVLILIALMATCLAGCGGLKGTYTEKDGNESLTFSRGNKVTISDGGSEFLGKYSIDGDVMHLTYTDPLGYDWDLDYSYSKKGNTISLDGDEYIKESKGGAWIVVLVIVLLAVAGGAGYVLIQRQNASKKRRRRVANEDLQDRVRQVSKSVASSAADMGSRAAATAKGLSSVIAAGVSAGVAAGKAAQKERKRVYVSPDTCCICGRSLENGSISLSGLLSGREAWIDRSCLKKLETIAEGDDPEEFAAAVRYMKSHAEYLEPDVREALLGFIARYEGRFDAPERKTFSL